MGIIGNAVNQFMIEELISGMIGHIGDKQMVKEKATEVLGHLDKLGDDDVIMILKLNGVTHLAITKKSHMEDDIFKKNPDFIDIEAIIKNTIDNIR